MGGKGGRKNTYPIEQLISVFSPFFSLSLSLKKEKNRCRRFFSIAEPPLSYLSLCEGFFFFLWLVLINEISSSRAETIPPPLPHGMGCVITRNEWDLLSLFRRGAKLVSTCNVCTYDRASWIILKIKKTRKRTHTAHERRFEFCSFALVGIS